MWNIHAVICFISSTILVSIEKDSTILVSIEKDFTILVSTEKDWIPLHVINIGFIVVNVFKVIIMYYIYYYKTVYFNLGKKVNFFICMLQEYTTCSTIVEQSYILKILFQESISCFWTQYRILEPYTGTWVCDFIWPPPCHSPILRWSSRNGVRSSILL